MVQPKLGWLKPLNIHRIHIGYSCVCHSERKKSDKEAGFRIERVNHPIPRMGCWPNTMHNANVQRCNPLSRAIYSARSNQNRSRFPQPTDGKTPPYRSPRFLHGMAVKGNASPVANRSHQVKTSLVQILRPDFANRDRFGNIIIPKLVDYIIVPRLATYGTHRIVDTLPMETLVKLSHFRDQLAGVNRRKSWLQVN